MYTDSDILFVKASMQQKIMSEYSLQAAEGGLIVRGLASVVSGCLAVTDVILELLWCGEWEGCLAANVICGHDIWGLLRVLHSTESGTAVSNVSAT